ncbi:predicted protein [Postia placenta Mad-698-R]|nr:predicted protein [Postia placenta Mad-698-R]
MAEGASRLERFDETIDLESFTHEGHGNESPQLCVAGGACCMHDSIDREPLNAAQALLCIIQSQAAPHSFHHLSTKCQECCRSNKLMKTGEWKSLQLPKLVGLTSMPWCSFQIDCIDYACVALLAYYVVLNLPHDVRHLWGRRSIATLLSVINWLAITASIITYMPFPNNTTQSLPSHSHSVLEVVAALRVHAYMEYNKVFAANAGVFQWELTQETWLFVPQHGCTGSASVSQATTYALVIITRGSVVVSDILVVAATWYYISHTSSIREQLVCGVWAARPNLTTVMFRDGTLYFMLSSILVSHFLICIREAAERSIVDSQNDSGTHRWLSSIEFAADIVNPSAGDSDADAFFDLEDDVDSRSEDSTVNGINDEIELHEYATANCSVDAFMS